MFVRSRMTRDVVYRKGGRDWVIKAGTATSIDESFVSAKELKALYGTRIDIYSVGYSNDEKPEENVKENEKETPTLAQKPEENVKENEKETPTLAQKPASKNVNSNKKLVDVIANLLERPKQEPEPTKAEEEKKEAPNEDKKPATTKKKTMGKKTSTRKSKNRQ